MVRLPSRQYRYSCVNCGFEGQASAKGAPVLLWVVLVAVVWNAWQFHHERMELEALGACVFALLGGWATFKLPRWIQCPACGWKHPVGESDKH